MQLLVVVLNKEEFLEKILTIFVEAGIAGATIIDSAGMGRVVSYDIPIFAGLRSILKGSHPYNKTIFSVVKDDKALEDTIEMIRNVVDFKEEGTGVLFTLPVSNMYGLSPDELKW